MIPWKEIKIVNSVEQDILLNPTPEMDGVELSFSEDTYSSNILYLKKEEIIALKNSLDEMVNYLKL